MARFAITSTLLASRKTNLPEHIITHVVDTGTAGNVYLAFDNSVITSASDLANICKDLAARCVGYGNLKP